MNENLIRLRELSTPMSENDRQASEYRQRNRNWLKKSRQVALSVMHQLEVQGMKKSELATKMGVTPTYIGKLLKGRENLTLETICKLEEVLGVDLQTIQRTYIKPSLYVLYSESEGIGMGNEYVNNEMCRVG